MTSGKIPNRLILIGMIAGILTTETLWECIIQNIIVLVILFPFFSISAIGAGDIKCICMAGFFLNSRQFFNSIVYCFIIAAVFSLCKIVWDHSLRKRMKHFFSYLRHCFLCQKFFPYETEYFNQKHTIHLAVPIFLGVLLSVGGTYL